MSPAFWNGKRVFLTGHTGFKGSWLTLWLEQLGATVCGFSLAPATTPALFDDAKVAGSCEHHIGDIRDYGAVARAMSAFKPDIVLHLAAQAIVRTSYEDPIETYGSNVMGTVHVLEAARKTPSVRVIVNVTSDKCYENREWLWGYREIDPMGGHDPYSSSKGCAELVASAFARSYFHLKDGPVLGSARAGNVIGGGDWARDRLIPDIVRAFLAGKAVEIRQPDSVRPWQHVLEPLSGYILLAEKLWQGGQNFAGGWNFGPDASAVMPVRAVADTMVRIWGADSCWIDRSDPHALHEAKLLQLDSTKARINMGWQPRWAFRTALEATADWYRKTHEGASPRDLCLQQIAQYAAAH